MRPLHELIALGESFTVEFKSSWSWDVRRGVPDKVLRHASLKTIAAFLNSEGGTLLIGVEDDGNAAGLEQDLSLLDGSFDRLQQQIIQGVIDSMGANAAAHVRIRSVNTDGRTVAVVDVDPSPEPVYARTDKGDAFFCRLANTTRSLGIAELQAYVDQHWSG